MSNTGNAMGGHQSARPGTVIWLTPPHVIAALGGPDAFALDPCGLEGSPIRTARQAYHGNGAALIFARTETEVFHRLIWREASGLLFLEGRLHFHHPDGTRAKANAGAPSVLVAYGADEMDRLAACDLPGAFVPLRLARGVVVLGLGAANDEDSTWRDLVLHQVRASAGSVTLSDLYRALARHPKAARNPNWRAKVRQTLKRAGARRVGPATYAA